MRDFEPPAKFITCAGDAGMLDQKKMAVLEGIELLFAFYFVENGSEWIDLYEIKSMRRLICTHF
jgi:hypothetical protein